MCSNNIDDGAIYEASAYTELELDFARDLLSRRTLECLERASWSRAISMTRRNELAAERSLTVLVSIITGTPCGELIFSFTDHLPSPSSIGRGSPLSLHTPCIWSRWSIAATDSRNYIRLTTATNNYPRATFRSFWRFTWSIPMATEMNALSLNLPLPTINYPCYLAKDSRKLRFGSIASVSCYIPLPPVQWYFN